MSITEGLALPLQRLAQQRLSGSEVALILQQQAEVVDGPERVWVPIAERLAQHLQRLAVQRLSGGEIALDLQQLAEVVDGAQRVRMPIAEGLARPLQRLAEQRLSGGEVALGTQQHAEVVDGGERVLVPVAQGHASHLQRLAEPRLSLVVRTIHALGPKPCTQKLEAQRVAVVVLAHAAAVGRVLLVALAPPIVDAGFVGPLAGAAAGAQLHERAVGFPLQADPAPLLVLLVLIGAGDGLD
eukprot:scaffold59458_cov64-Phaeocystis_antarctica.AAC.1